MDCKVRETRKVEVTISKGELLELVAKRIGKLPPEGAMIILDTYSMYSCASGRKPSFDTIITWNEEIK